MKINIDEYSGKWLEHWLNRLSATQEKVHSIAELTADYEQNGADFEELWQGPVIDELRQMGLLVL